MKIMGFFTIFTPDKNINVIWFYLIGAGGTTSFIIHEIFYPCRDISWFYLSDGGCRV